MTPPMNDIITPTGQTVYTNITSVFPPRTPETQPNAALAEFAGRVVDSYAARIADIDEKTERAIASRRAYLTAPYTP